MKKQGFTLIEVLVSATIIAVLTAVGIVTYTNITKRSRDAKRKGDVEQIRSALEMYRSDHGTYPSIGAGSYANADTLSGDLVTDYMAAIPKDPKEPTYTYRYQAKSFTGGNYYDYCISVFIESEADPSETCAYDAVNGHNYGLKSP